MYMVNPNGRLNGYVVGCQMYTVNPNQRLNGYAVGC